MKENKVKLAKYLKEHFPAIIEKDYNYNRIDFSINRELVPSVLRLLKEESGYIHLSHISCVDWLEEEEFELVFIIWSPVDKIKILIHTRIDRNNPVMDNIDKIWRQANTYEREIKEMYGIEFTGLEAADEFLLEDWNGMPPMRRDFDTAAYASNKYYNRPGREDAMDVREEIARHSGEEIPDFAKKYSR